MPELPDVEVFGKYLKTTSLHKKIKEVHVPEPDILKGVSTGKLKKSLKDTRFEAVVRHGKNLFAELDSDGYLVFHFGMTGFLKYFKIETEKPDHVRLMVKFANGYCLAYDCSRKLGMITLTNDIGKFIKDHDIGPDALDPDFAISKFREVMKGRGGSIKPALMNQKIISGIGNIYSDEILFQAGIHPKTGVSDLDSNSLGKIYHEMRDHVLPDAVKAKADPEKLPESFIIPQRKDNGHCPKCNSLLKSEKISGRTSYFCPECQK